MRRFFLLISVAVAALWLASCEEDLYDPSDVALFVSPSASEVPEVYVGDKQLYEVEMYTQHSYVARVQVSSFDAYFGERVLKDTTWGGPVPSFRFVYEALPADRDSLEVELTFRAWDDAGSTCEVSRSLLVLGREVLLAEKAGIVLYPPSSGRPDAMSFADPSQTFSWLTSPDSVRADMYIDADAGLSQVTLRSNTAAKFVRHNSFDYAAATAPGLQAVYASSNRVDAVASLAVNDIVLVGHGERAEGVLRVSNIIRDPYGGESCVQIAFKGLASE